MDVLRIAAEKAHPNSRILYMQSVKSPDDDLHARSLAATDIDRSRNFWLGTRFKFRRRPINEFKDFFRAFAKAHPFFGQKHLIPTR